MRAAIVSAIASLGAAHASPDHGRTPQTAVATSQILSQLLPALPGPTGQTRVSAGSHGCGRRSDVRGACTIGRDGDHARLGPAAAAWFVDQTLDAPLQKPLRPLIDKASADPDGVGNMGDRHPIGHQ